MKKIPTAVAGVIAGVALAVAAATYAQPFAGMGPGFGPGFGPGMGMGPGHGPIAGAGDATALMEARLGEFKAQLNITSPQENAWQAFTAAAKQQAEGMQALRAQMQQGATTASDRMGQRTQLMQQRAAGMTTMTNAFNALYAVLTPEQRAIADQHFGMGFRGPGFGGRAG
jgi:protein CpxP